MWHLGVFDRLRNIIATVHARASVSKVVGAWHENFHRTLEAKLLAALRAQGVPAEDLAFASRVVMFVIEGLLAHPTSAKDRRALLQWLVSVLQSRQRTAPNISAVFRPVSVLPETRPPRDGAT